MRNRKLLAAAAAACCLVALAAQPARADLLDDIMKAKKKPLDTFTLESLGVQVRSRVKAVRFDIPPQRQKGVLVKDAEELVAALKSRGLV